MGIYLKVLNYKAKKIYCNKSVSTISLTTGKKGSVLTAFQTFKEKSSKKTKLCQGLM